ncbi:MAG TPA: ribosomal protein S18-alanine N-acetyltransferase [Vicinamibacterales bacterium]|jgi:ribosomal-protein-alanine N-acetyltransferase
MTLEGDRPAWNIERVVTDRDLEAVLEIEAMSFTNPWTREMYLREMDNPRVSHIYLVRVETADGAAVAGFCSFWLVFDELHINNLAIHPMYRRRGIGTALLQHAMRTAARLGARRATLEVRQSNEEARRIYERLGFETAGIRRNYYAHPTEDALILWRPDLHGVDQR